MNFFRKAWLVAKFLGPRWVVFRLRYAWQLRSCVLQRRLPCTNWQAIEAAVLLPDWLQAPEFPASGKAWGNSCVSNADAIAEGKFQFFSHRVEMVGCPPDWHKNAFTRQAAPRGRHWSQLGDFDFGDIKVIWELSRFGWAYALARAYTRTKDRRYAELFWNLFVDWCAQNPPNEGVNWKCGQESTFRLMAVTFAVATFGRTSAATTERIQLWSRFVLVTGRRIAANLDYALSQSNNHGVSECIGLITASLLLPETSETLRWRETGWTHLRTQLEELVYADGGFSQHSLIYHRVLLHDLYWLISLLRRAGQEVPEWLLAKAHDAHRFFAILVDQQTGGAPLYGANDGAYILPLDDCDFDDFRSVVHLGDVLLDGVRTLPPGPWDEAAFWLLGCDPANLPSRTAGFPNQWHAPHAGCLQWQSGESRLFLRCPTHFRHRPSQADMLHADVWWRGQPIAFDAGSYSNNMPPPLGGAFGNAAVHNVPMLAGLEPLQKAGRFLYLPWPEGKAGFSADRKSFCASHEGYGDNAQVERQISSAQSGAFSITDAVVVRQPQTVRLHWLLRDAGWKLAANHSFLAAEIDGCQYEISWMSETKADSITLVRADPASARGWRSRFYLAVEPAVSLELLFNVRGRLIVTTTFSPV